MNPKLLALHIGQPKTYTDDQGTWETAFFKETIREPIFLGSLGLQGDGVANTIHHGGEEQAVLLYCADHYALWQAELGKEFPFGAFAENLSVSGMDENTVYIGDIYQIGAIKLQVTKPRIPCWKIARRWKMPNLTKKVAKTNRTGWYCRVLQEGEIKAGLPVVLLSRQDLNQTVAQAFQSTIKS